MENVVWTVLAKAGASQLQRAQRRLLYRLPGNRLLGPLHIEQVRQTFVEVNSLAAILALAWILVR